ncbi:neutral/alkaline non-lysosomal ceramidase N-terminal domain-containing protein [Isosphaeraceae bacterium EP7]
MRRFHLAALAAAFVGFSTTLTLAAETPATTFRAGFGEVDITPPNGTPRQGWNTKLVGEGVLDPIFARAAVFDRGGSDPGLPLAIIQLDVALVNTGDTATIRAKVEADHKIPGNRVMVTATHNHAGPAVINEALPRSEAYIATMVAGASKAVGKALAARQESEMAVGVAFELNVAYNRRVIMRDGSARTHGSFTDPNALAYEGPIDPEVAVLALRGADGKIVGALVNFACHPTHHGGDQAFSAGYPGVIAKELKAKGIPVTLFLQGAAGNIAYDDPHRRPDKTKEQMGAILADDVIKALAKPKWIKPSTLSAASKTVDIPYRKATKADIEGTAKGTQRFGEAGYYERKIPGILAMIAEKKTEPGEVQVFRLGDMAFASQPSESFVEHGLMIKEQAWPVRTFVVCYANGMLGYLPHEAAFARGGYECSFGPPSMMAPEAGRLLAEAAVELIKGK